MRMTHRLVWPLTALLTVGLFRGCGGDFQIAAQQQDAGSANDAGSGGGSADGAAGEADGTAGSPDGTAGSSGGSVTATGGRAGGSGGIAGATGGTGGTTAGTGGHAGGSGGVLGEGGTGGPSGGSSAGRGGAAGRGGTGGRTGGAAGRTGGAAGTAGDGGTGAAGGSAGDGGTAGTTAGAGGTTGGMGGATGGSAGGPGHVQCPDAPPSEGSACTLPDDSASYSALAHCSYGDDPRPECRTRALCEQDGTWQLSLPAESCSEPLLPPECSSPPPASGADCTDTAVTCWYEDGTRCWCSECLGGSPYPNCAFVDPPQWACATPAADCPILIPQAGEPCDVPGASCGPDCEFVVVCEDGVWQWRVGSCPICASPDTPIATPTGQTRIADLRPGDPVYSVHEHAVVAVPILRAASTPVQRHWVMRVQLDSGAVLEISPGHPTAQGRSFGELSAGDRLDERHAVVSAQLVPYAHDRTYDILPDSSSGSYFAAGALVGSTLHSRPVQAAH
jgi:hypothetical protein